jgi:hypothetical protein
MQCTGKPVLKCLRRHDETMPPTYFIGCAGWKPNEKFYRFIGLKENIDISLLKQLLNGLYEVRYNYYFFSLFKLYLLIILFKI